MSNVTRLIDRAPVAVGSQQEMGDWLMAWAEGFRDGDYGKLRSVVVLVESDDGQVACVSQSLGSMDRTRLIGLLMTAAHRKMDGGASVEDMVAP